MFSNNITLKATIQAEKEKEKTDNRLAARYIKIRALLDEAERSINAANIARSLKNQLISKLLKARRSLDKGLHVDEVIEIMTLIVAMINHQIKLDKRAIDQTTSEMRRDLDTFYKYDFDKFLRSEASSRQSQDRLSPNNEVLRSRSRSREAALPRIWRRSPSEGARQPRTEDKVPPPSGRSRSIGSRGGIIPQEQNLDSVKEEDTKIREDPEPETVVESEQEAGVVELSSKPDETGSGIDSLDEEEEELAEDPVKQHTLETLVTSLNILQEIPKLKLNKNQQNYLGPTMRASKPLLQTVTGCSALTGPLNMLKNAIDSKTDGRPKEPLFTQALVEMNIVISSFEIADRKSAEGTIKSFETD